MIFSFSSGLSHSTEQHAGLSNFLQRAGLFFLFLTNVSSVFTYSHFLYSFTSLQASSDMLCLSNCDYCNQQFQLFVNFIVPRCIAMKGKLAHVVFLFSLFVENFHSITHSFYINLLSFNHCYKGSFYSECSSFSFIKNNSHSKGGVTVC